MTANILTLKWGDKYAPEYANRLYSGVHRHLGLDFRFLCFTDDRSGLRPEIEAHPIPDFDVPPAWQRTPWLKLALFRDDYGLRSPASACFSTLISSSRARWTTSSRSRRIVRASSTTGRTPCSGSFAATASPGNSSVFRFESGKSGAILDRFMAERDQALAQYRTVVDQRYLAEALGPDMAWWPPEWVVSFKRHCIPAYPLNRFAAPRLPSEARIVVFNGHPNPDEALAGYRSDRAHRSCLPTGWIAEHWR